MRCEQVAIEKLYYLAHPARRSLMRVRLLMSELSSVTWSHSHLVRAPFTLLASSAAEVWKKKKKEISQLELISPVSCEFKVCPVKLVHVSHQS